MTDLKKSNLSNQEKKRVFLFLQGPSSSIFRKIAAKLEANGHTCLRINLNVGDWIFWREDGMAIIFVKNQMHGLLI